MNPRELEDLPKMARLVQEAYDDIILLSKELIRLQKLLSGRARWQEIEHLSNEIKRLSKIEQAAINLIKVKGRYHSEQAYKQLKKVLGEK